MSADALRWLERAHGAVAWLAVAGLSIALALLRRRRRDGGLSAAWPALAAAAALTVAFATGLALDLPYRGLLRQRVFIDAATLGWLFERKLHLAFGALALCWCGVAARAAAARAAPRAAHLERAARVSLAAAAAFALAAAVFSAIVASRHRF